MMNRFYRFASPLATTTWLVTLALSLLAFSGEADADDPAPPTNKCGVPVGAVLGTTCSSDNCQTLLKTCKNDSCIQNADGSLKCNRTDCESAATPSPTD